MTLPDEMFLAIRNARNFLVDLTDPQKTPKIPRSVRREARERLKHFPSEYDVEQLKNLFDVAHTDPKVLLKSCFDELASINASTMMANQRTNKVASVLSNFGANIPR